MHILKLVVISLSCVIQIVNAGDEYSYTSVPLYDLRTKSHALEVTLKQKSYIQNLTYKWKNSVNVNYALKKNTPEKLLMEYLESLYNGSGTSQFYYDDKRKKLNKTIADLIKARVKGIKNITYRTAWLFKNYSVVVVGVLDKKNKMTTLSLAFEEIEGKIYRFDDWGDYKAIGSMFAYMSGNVKSGRLDKITNLDFKHKVWLEGGERGLAVSFNGNIFSDNWFNIGDRESKVTDLNSEALSFIYFILSSTQSLSDDKFISLWDEKYKSKFSLLKNSSAEGMRSLKRHYHVEEKIKNIALLELEDGIYAYYFVTKLDGNKIRVLYVKRHNKKFYLTESIYSNIKVLLESKLFKKSLGGK